MGASAEAGDDANPTLTATSSAAAAAADGCESRTYCQWIKVKVSVTFAAATGHNHRAQFLSLRTAPSPTCPNLSNSPERALGGSIWKRNNGNFPRKMVTKHTSARFKDFTCPEIASFSNVLRSPLFSTDPQKIPAKTVNAGVHWNFSASHPLSGWCRFNFCNT